MSHFKSLIARWRCLFKGERREEDTNNNPTMIYRFNQAKGDASLLFTRTISFGIQQVSPPFLPLEIGIVETPGASASITLRISFRRGEAFVI